jgi:hypothetical protein
VLHFPLFQLVDGHGGFVFMLGVRFAAMSAVNRGGLLSQQSKRLLQFVMSRSQGGGDLPTTVRPLLLLGHQLTTLRLRVGPD